MESVEYFLGQLTLSPQCFRVNILVFKYKINLIYLVCYKQCYCSPYNTVQNFSANGLSWRLGRQLQDCIAQACTEYLAKITHKIWRLGEPGVHSRTLNMCIWGMRCTQGMGNIQRILPGWNMSSYYSFNGQLVLYNSKMVSEEFHDSRHWEQWARGTEGTGHLEGNFLPHGLVSSMVPNP